MNPFTDDLRTSSKPILPTAKAATRLNKFSPISAGKQLAKNTPFFQRDYIAKRL